MNEYRVTALGIHGTEFVYRVTAKGEMSASCEAYGAHGQSLRSGEQTEPLGPRHTVELLSD